MKSNSWMALVVAACTATGAVSAPSDPLATPACRQALDALARVERAAQAQGAAQPGAAASGVAPAWVEARRSAARACLAAGDDAASAPRGARSAAPIVVPANRLPMPHAPRFEQPAPAPVLPPPRPAPSVTSCDAGGCWASDGTRVQRYGTELYGPRGRCTVQAGTLVCP